MGQKLVGRMIVPVIVFGPANENLKETTNLQTPAERLKKTEPSKASEAASFEGEIEFSEAFGHTSQTYLRGTFVESSICIDQTRYPYAPTATQ